MIYNEVSWSNVIVSDKLLLEKQEANRRYLMSLDSDSLLLNFRTEAVLNSPFGTKPEKIHGGWEHLSSQLRGHFLGSWLSAAAMQYASTGDMELKVKADVIVGELKKCQEANGGEWAASIPEKYFDRIAHDVWVWAPHWTVWKTFMGLLDMYRFAGNNQALEICRNWTKWFLRWTEQFSREKMDDILDVETGGILETWAILYGITKDEDYITLMDRYYRGRLFDPLLADRDVLTNMHANTTIPEILGAAAAYEVTGKEKWLRIVEAYWKFAVTLRGTYATGGQSSGEIWTPKMELAARLGDKNQEHCTVYNMMRLADFLIRVTGKKEYADYWERNLYNGVFAQCYWETSYIHGNFTPYPDHGLLTYFLPLRAGGRKSWSSETEDFFCCHGTMVQANAALNRGIYYVSGGKKTASVAVCQFFNSDVKFAVGSTTVNIKQIIDPLTGSNGIQILKDFNEDYPLHSPDYVKTTLEITTDKPVDFEIKIRVPFWAKADPELYVNGKKESCKNTDGWLSLVRSWNKDTIRVEIKRGISSCPLPDKKDMTAFLYGPVVLAGLCEEELLLRGDIRKPEEFIVPDNEREWGIWMQSFKTRGQAKNIRFVPLYKIGYEPYTVYFPVNF
jgi:DUF1680 family protein